AVSVARQGGSARPEPMLARRAARGDAPVESAPAEMVISRYPGRSGPEEAGSPADGRETGSPPWASGTARGLLAAPAARRGGRTAGGCHPTDAGSDHLGQSKVVGDRIGRAGIAGCAHPRVLELDLGEV